MLVGCVLNAVAFVSVLWRASPVLVYMLIAYATLGTYITVVGFGRPLMSLHWESQKR